MQLLIEGVPWQRRKEVGLFNALWQTALKVMIKPVDFFEKFKTDDSLVEPFLFYFLVTFISSVVSLVVQILLGRFPVSMLILTTVSLMISICLGIFIMSGLMHLFVMLFGGKGGFKSTFSILCFSSAANIVTIIPFIGTLVAWIWAIILGVTGYKHVHKMTMVKAAAAYMILPFLLVLLAVLLPRP